MKIATSLLALAAVALAVGEACAQEKVVGDSLKPLNDLFTPAPTPAATPMPSASNLPPALSGELATFAREELSLEQQDDPRKIARFYTFPLEDEGRAVSAGDFCQAWTAYAKGYRHRVLETLNIKFLTYDAATDSVELQQTYGMETQPAAHSDTERKLIVRQLRIVRAGRPTRAIDRRFTTKEFWTYDTRLSTGDHYATGGAKPLASDTVGGAGLRMAVNAIIRQDRVNYYSGANGRDADDQPCAYFDDGAHRDLLLQARLKLIPDTPETLEAIIHGTPRVRVSFSDNLRGENRDGYPILNIGVLDK